MATKIEGDVKRGTDTFLAVPSEIQVDPKLRGRVFPPSDEQVATLAVSIAERGQLTPVECRRLHDKRLAITAGYTRLAAVNLLRQGFEYQGKTYHIPDLRVRVIVFDCNEDEALKRAITENTHRTDRSPVDDAFNIRDLRERFGWSNAEIAAFYGWHVSKVTRLASIVSLPDGTLRKLHAGDITLAAAMELASLPPGTHAAVIEETGGKATEIRERKRTEQAPRPVQRTVKQVREMLDRYTSEETNPAMRAFALIALSYLSGEIDEREVERQICDLEGVKPAK